MKYFALFCIVFGSVWLLRHMIRNKPRITPARAPRVVSLILLFAAAVLLVQGKMVAALVPGLLGFAVAGYSLSSLVRALGPPGQNSIVSTSLLSVELDGESGRLDGKILAGVFAGRLLADLDDRELSEFFDSCHSAQDQSLALFQAWLDRARPEWRAAWSGLSGTSRPGLQSNTMGRGEALAILGLTSAATEAEIRKAHRTLIKGCHPDKGGSHYLAAKINEAKDVLLQS